MKRSGKGRGTRAATAGGRSKRIKPNPALDKVFAPLFVARPPSDAYIGLCMLESGEIRHYNYGEQRDEDTWYIHSLDGGLTWEKKAPPKGATRKLLYMRADTRDPVSGEYIRLTGARHVAEGGRASGTVVIRSSGGHEGAWSAAPAHPERLGMLKPPIFIRGGRRIIVPTQVSTDQYTSHIVMVYSNDRGRTWKLSKTTTIPKVKNWRTRANWNHGPCEPTVVELNDGRLWALMRTGRDNFWESFSPDGGITWGECRPSRFYACKTMPTIGRLGDGRILLSWCNTTPLPCLPRSEATRILMGNLRQYGINTDMFTNRDAAHLAISEDDGRTWIGFRELFLDQRRNAGDYGETGGIDRGMHQSQFLELGGGKVLISFGQHWLHRSMAVFDLEWLYEKSRSGDFANGLDDWSVQTFFAGVQGHRALNRKAGAELIAHPDRRGRQVLHICRPHDPELITENQGATWNFPAAKAGSFTTRIMPQRGCGGFCISLIDRWFNPTDLVAPAKAMYSLHVGGPDRHDWRSEPSGMEGRIDRRTKLPAGRWSELRFEWDGVNSGGRTCRLLIDGKARYELPLNRRSRNGISYAHFISTATAEDRQGFLIESVKAEGR